MTEKTSFVLHTSYAPAVHRLSDEDAGALFKGLFAYVDSDTVPTLSPLADMAFAFIRDMLDRDADKYARTCQRRAEAGRRGGIASGETRSKQSQASEASASKSKQTKQKQANEADGEGVGEGEGNTEEINLFSSEPQADSDEETHSESIKGRKGRQRPIYAPDNKYMKTAEWLANDIAKKQPGCRRPTPAQLQNWANEFRLLEERDHIAWDIIRETLIFARNDSFWAGNILSGGKFRAQYDALRARMEAPAKTPAHGMIKPQEPQYIPTLGEGLVLD